jgi:Ca2+-binding EF-hand superfamily protein
MWKVIKAGVLGLLVLAMGLSPALAAKPGKGKKDPDQSFKKLDSNNDGALSLEEMKGKGKKDAATVEKRFKKMDRNSDGKVSLDEMKNRGKKKNKNA